MGYRVCIPLVAALLLSIFEAGHHHFCSSFTCLSPASQCGFSEPPSATVSDCVRVDLERPQAGRLAPDSPPGIVREMSSAPSRGRAPPLLPSSPSASNPISVR